MYQLLSGIIGGVSVTTWIKIAVVIAAFSSGYKVATWRIESDQLATIQASNDEWQDKFDQLEQRRIAAVKLANKLRNRPPEVITNEIIKVVEKSDCHAVSDDMLRMLNGD